MERQGDAAEEGERRRKRVADVSSCSLAHFHEVPKWRQKGQHVAPTTDWPHFRLSTKGTVGRANRPRLNAGLARNPTKCVYIRDLGLFGRGLLGMCRSAPRCHYLEEQAPVQDLGEDDPLLAIKEE